MSIASNRRDEHWTPAISDIHLSSPDLCLLAVSYGCANTLRRTWSGCFYCLTVSARHSIAMFKMIKHSVPRSPFCGLLTGCVFGPLSFCVALFGFVLVCNPSVLLCSIGDCYVLFSFNF